MERRDTQGVAPELILVISCSIADSDARLPGRPRGSPVQYYECCSGDSSCIVGATLAVALENAAVIALKIYVAIRRAGS